MRPHKPLIINGRFFATFHPSGKKLEKKFRGLNTAAMGFPLHSVEQEKRLVSMYIFPKKFRKKTKTLDIYHYIDKGYKELDWEEETQERRRVTKMLQSPMFKTLTGLSREGTVRATRTKVSTSDLMDELFRREVCSQLDEMYWVTLESRTKPKARHRKKAPARSKQRRIRVKICKNVVLGGFKNKYNPESPVLKERIAEGKRYLKENSWVYDRAHPLYCRNRELSRYFEENFLKKADRVEEIAGWAREHCRAVLG